MVIFVVAIPKTIPCKGLPLKAASAGTLALLDVTAVGSGEIERRRRRPADLNARDLLQGRFGPINESATTRSFARADTHRTLTVASVHAHQLR